MEFQFTHPGKGATSECLCLGGVEVVSIHAPWEGCDPCAGTPQGSVGCFNSRTLGRVRLLVIRTLRPVLHVSIHAPWEGCDRDKVDC